MDYIKQTNIIGKNYYYMDELSAWQKLVQSFQVP